MRISRMYIVYMLSVEMLPREVENKKMGYNANIWPTPNNL